MKEITIKIDEQTFNAINNAVIAGIDIYTSIQLCCIIPSKFSPLEKLSDEEIQQRKEKLSNFYKELEDKFLRP